MPVWIPIAMLAAAAVAGGVQAGMAAKKSKYDKEMEARKAELARKEKWGGLGLTGREKDVMERTMMAPVQANMTQLQQQQERLLSATGGTSGEQIGQVRRDISHATARATQSAADLIAQADIAKAEAQRAEISQLGAALEGRRVERLNNAFGAITDTLGAAGSYAGQLSDQGTASSARMPTESVPGQVGSLQVEGSGEASAYIQEWVDTGKYDAAL
ncbi:MAG TPA: hypothetical protein VFF65_04075, partial [Phycisphaerales bacterium]|nr:hypothetical protein [Phycisphaerales bacterium]